MQGSENSGAGNPFTDGHRAAARKAEQKANSDFFAQRIERATAKGEAAKRPKPLDKPFVGSGPIWK